MPDDTDENIVHRRPKNAGQYDLDHKADPGSIPADYGATSTAGEKARRLAALVAVADTYGLDPVATWPGVYLAHCPVCGDGPGYVQTLIIHATHLRRGTIFACSACGASGSRPKGLQRLASTRARAAYAAVLAILDALAARDAEKARAALAAELADALAAHGDDARRVCDRVAATVAQLAECPCADCEGQS